MPSEFNRACFEKKTLIQNIVALVDLEKHNTGEGRQKYLTRDCFVVNYDKSETYNKICCPAQQAGRDYNTFEHGVSIGLFPSGANDVSRLRNTTENCFSITKQC